MSRRAASNISDNSSCASSEQCSNDKYATLLRAVTQEEVIDLEDACQMALSLGLAAFQYGSPASRVQMFVENLLKKMLKTDDNELTVCCRFTQSECLLCVEQYKTRPITYMKAAHGGCHMDKLSQLSVLVRNLAHVNNINIQEIQQKLEQIKKTPDPWGTIYQLTAWCFVGVALPPVLQSTWYDVLLGGITAAIAFWIGYVIETNVESKFIICRGHWTLGGLMKRFVFWENLIQAFVAAFIASICQAFWQNSISPSKVVLGAIAVPLPGYGISVGVMELAMNNITAGLAHMIQGLLTLLLLVIGAVLGITSGQAIKETDPLTDPIQYVDNLWFILWVPLLSIGLALALQNSRSDFPWSVLCEGFSFAMSYVALFFPDRNNIGYFFSGLALTIFANVWAIIKKQSPLPLLIPSFIMTISGSIGFRGILNYAEGQTELGSEQFWHMFVVAVVTAVGVLVGCYVVRPNNVI